jgi:hypothetical protein
MARCPAHDDQNPSLSISCGQDGRILLKCFAGCSTEAVVEALGLKFADLSTSNNDRKWTKADADRALAGRGLRRETTDYFHITTDLDKQAWAFPLGKGRVTKYKSFVATKGRAKYWSEKGASLGAYHLNPCAGAPSAWLVEGEPDVWIMWQAGVKAFSMTGGAGHITQAIAMQIASAKIGTINIVGDHDESGREGAQKVAATLQAAIAQTGSRTRVEIRELPSDVGPGGDVTTLYNNLGRDDAAFRQTLAELPEAPDAPNCLVGAERARPRIVIRPELNAMTDEAITAINARPELGVYVRGRMLVQVARDGSPREKWLRRPPGAPVIVAIEHAAMLAVMDDAASWGKLSKENKFMPQMPPDRIAKQILARLEWPFPYLEAVLESPTLRPDGSLLIQPGWDLSTGLLYDPPPGISWPTVPDPPTSDEVRHAVEVLLDPVCDFPFVAETDRTAYLAAVLTLIARHCIDGPTPMFPVRAPTPGTGKTLLADVVGLIGTGRIPAAMSMTYEAEELRKRILALAVAGTACVKIDNASGSLGSDALAAALTSTHWEDRILGHTQMVRVPLRTVWLATGNNLAFRRTLARRVVPIDLDARREQPEDRTEFRHADLLRYVQRERPRLVAAALTLLRAFHVAGRPSHGGARMGSFEAWDDQIRSALIWAELEDPAGTDSVMYGRGRIREEADDDTERLGTLLAELARVYSAEMFTAADVIRRAGEDPELGAVLDVAACPAKGGPASVKSLGATLREAKGRPVGGLVLERRKRAWSVRESQS